MMTQEIACRSITAKICDHVKMKAEKEPEFIQGGHLKFEGVKQIKCEGYQQQNETSNASPEWQTRSREAAAAHSWKIQ